MMVKPKLTLLALTVALSALVTAPAMSAEPPSWAENPAQVITHHSVTEGGVTTDTYQIPMDGSSKVYGIVFDDSLSDGKQYLTDLSIVSQLNGGAS